MAIEKLKSRFVETVTAKGFYADGGGLYLRVEPGSKSWVFRYHVDGKGDRKMGLGSFETVRLVEARELARICRQQRLNGVDPIEARIDQKLAASKEVTLQQCFQQWFDIKETTVDPGTAAMIRRRWEIHVPTPITKLPIQKFDMRDASSSAVELVARVVQPIWHSMNFTARMLQGDFRAILNYAIAKRYIAGDNAADPNGPLQFLLARTKDFYVVDHHAALPYQEIGKFMAALRLTGAEPIAPRRTRLVHCAICESPHAHEIIAARSRGASPENLGRRFGFPSGSMSRHLQEHVGRPFIRPLPGYALEFMILTAVRREQASSARWDEIDLDKRQWTCSQHKTKKKVGKDYVAMLNSQAISVLNRMKEWQKVSGIESKFVFDTGVRGRFAGQGLKRDSITKFLIRVMKRKDITVHGFRTAFGSWALDTGQDDTAREMALGHQVGNAISQIYTRQADKIEVRRLMMEAWGTYCDRTEPLPSSVIPFKQARQETA